MIFIIIYFRNHTKLIISKIKKFTKKNNDFFNLNDQKTLNFIQKIK